MLARSSSTTIQDVLLHNEMLQRWLESLSMSNPRKMSHHSYPLLSSSLIWNLVESVNITNLCLLTKPAESFMYISHTAV
jgi:hypothetical protein